MTSDKYNLFQGYHEVWGMINHPCSHGHHCDLSDFSIFNALFILTLRVQFEKNEKCVVAQSRIVLYPIFMLSFDQNQLEMQYIIITFTLIPYVADRFICNEE